MGHYLNLVGYVYSDMKAPQGSLEDGSEDVEASGEDEDEEAKEA